MMQELFISHLSTDSHSILLAEIYSSLNCSLIICSYCQIMLRCCCGEEVQEKEAKNDQRHRR